MYFLFYFSLPTEAAIVCNGLLSRAAKDLWKKWALELICQLCPDAVAHFARFCWNISGLSFLPESRFCSWFCSPRFKLDTSGINLGIEQVHGHILSDDLGFFHEDSVSMLRIAKRIYDATASKPSCHFLHLDTARIVEDKWGISCRSPQLDFNCSLMSTAS